MVARRCRSRISVDELVDLSPSLCSVTAGKLCVILTEGRYPSSTTKVMVFVTEACYVQNQRHMLLGETPTSRRQHEILYRAM